jgi:hypothetical protein
MNCIKGISRLLITVMLGGCASGPSDSGGARLVFTGRHTPDGPYAEVGAQFSTWGDFVALFSPRRWQEPIETGGMLSWTNPDAWRKDAGRTARILIGEAVVVAGAIAIGVAASGGSDDSGGTTGSGEPSPPDSGTKPDLPGGIGGGVIGGF